jgi:ADP-heptose:LPS heptosyltransferase
VIGDYCAAQGLQVALTGTAMEAGQIGAVAEQMRAPAVNLCDRLSLPGLAGLLSRAALFVGNDSGPMHLALAVGARAVGLFWVEYVVNSLPLTRTTFYPLIAWRRACPRCGAFLDKAEADHPSGGCSHDVSMIAEITPPDVIRGVEALLAR